MCPSSSAAIISRHQLEPQPQGFCLRVLKMKGASGFTGFARAARRHQRQTGLPGEAGALTAGGGQNGAGGCAAWVGSQG